MTAFPAAFFQLLVFPTGCQFHNFRCSILSGKVAILRSNCRFRFRSGGGRCPQTPLMSLCLAGESLKVAKRRRHSRLT
jgi:hypothetical protein